MQSINWAQVLTSVLIAIISSTGLWSYIANYRNKHDAKTKLLVDAANTSENISEKQGHWFATKALDFSDKSNASA